MGEIKILYSESQLSATDIKRDVTINTTPPVETILDVRTANQWIEKAKNKPISLPLLDHLYYHYLRFV